MTATATTTHEFTKLVEAQRFAREQRAAGHKVLPIRSNWETGKRTVTVIAGLPRLVEAPVSTTCQICGRAIRLVDKAGRIGATEVIAHHGYQRPAGRGFQTRSCLGARHLPYEVSCDLLPGAIRSAQSKLQSIRAEIEKWVSDPPAVLNVPERRSPYGSLISAAFSAERPEGFDGSGSERPDYMPKSYKTVYYEHLHMLRREVGIWEDELGYFTARLAAWRAPEAK